MRGKNAKPGPPGADSGPGRAALPRLELLRSFDAAARRLSFTLAAEQMFVTQSALSRQIQQLEADLGVPLFERRHRALALTPAGQVLHRTVVDILERLRDATALIRAPSPLRQIALTTTPGFASLWLIPRLARFTTAHGEVDVRISATLDLLDLDRHDFDIAVRFCAIAPQLGAPLFEETVVPVCAPALLDDARHPLRQPADLANHTLLTLDVANDPDMAEYWEPWARLMGLGGLQTKNVLRFNQYTDAVAAAVAGQGVVIGRLPLLNELMQAGRLVAPFQGGVASRRGYFVLPGRRAAQNRDAQDFVAWLQAEARQAPSVPGLT